MNREMTESALSEAIQAVRFALIELQLYLDMHPESAEALRTYTEYTDKLRELTAQYVRHYGPISMGDVTGKNGWTWGMKPMPSEGGK